MHVYSTFDLLLYYSNATLDDASRREERREQQRIRRADISSEQREEIKKKKREHMRNYQSWKRRLHPKIVAIHVLWLKHYPQQIKTGNHLEYILFFLSQISHLIYIQQINALL